MSTLEREILNVVTKLDVRTQQQVLEYVQRLGLATENPQLTLQEWLNLTNTFNQELTAKYGANYFESNQNVLDTIREERLNDLMGRR